MILELSRRRWRRRRGKLRERGQKTSTELHWKIGTSTGADAHFLEQPLKTKAAELSKGSTATDACTAWQLSGPSLPFQTCSSQPAPRLSAQQGAQRRGSSPRRHKIHFDYSPPPPRRHRPRIKPPATYSPRCLRNDSTPQPLPPPLPHSPPLLRHAPLLRPPPPPLNAGQGGVTGKGGVTASSGRYGR